jgi:hypothetical protein
MEELRRERARPRAADDFAMIRARMEELRLVAAARILAEPDLDRRAVLGGGPGRP